MARSLRIVHPDPDKHKSALFDLMGKSFGDYWGSLEYCRNGYIEDSHYNWRTSRIGLLDEEIVTHFGVWDFRMRIGTDTVRTGGIGAVMTDKRFRKRGYMKSTAATGCKAMSDEGYGLSVLFGIPDYYQRFGYVSAWNTSLITINERDLPKPSNRLKLRKFDPATEKGLDAIANRAQAGLTGTAVRPTYHRNRHPGQWNCYRWQPLSEGAGGFLVIEQEDHASTLIDCGGRAHDILSACIQLMKKQGGTELKIPELHRRHPLFDALIDVPFKREEYNNPAGGGMVKLTGLVTSLKSIRKTLMRRLRESAHATWNGTLHLQAGDESAVLVFDRRGLSVYDESEAKTKGIRQRDHRIRAGDEFAQLVIGLDDPYTLVRRHGIKISGDAKMLVGVLFPEQSPCLGKWDHI